MDWLRRGDKTPEEPGDPGIYSGDYWKEVNKYGKKI